MPGPAAAEPGARRRLSMKAGELHDARSASLPLHLDICAGCAMTATTVPENPESSAGETRETRERGSAVLDPSARLPENSDDTREGG